MKNGTKPERNAFKENLVLPTRESATREIHIPLEYSFVPVWFVVDISSKIQRTKLIINDETSVEKGKKALTQERREMKRKRDQRQ